MVQPQQKQVNTIFSISSMVRRWHSAIKLSFLKCQRLISWNILKYQKLFRRLISSRYLPSIICYSEHIISLSFWSIHKNMILLRCHWTKQFQQACSILPKTFPPYYILCTERAITLTHVSLQYWQLLQIFWLITVCTLQPKWMLPVSFLQWKKNWLYVYGIWLLV
jgi:hypothetical protein